MDQEWSRHHPRFRHRGHEAHPGRDLPDGPGMKTGAVDARPADQAVPRRRHARWADHSGDHELDRARAPEVTHDWHAHAVGWFSNRSTSSSAAGVPVLPPSPHRFAVVDVETTGLYATSCRVLSVAALALDEHGHPERQVVTLVDPGCDPGPVHIHGLTRQRLAGSPRFADVLPQLHDLLAGRVLVAHNASFDHGFLAAEAVRAGTTLPTRQRLCTVALSRRLGLDVPNHQLASVAAHWCIPQQHAHDAHDDALVTGRVLAHSLQLASRLGLRCRWSTATGTPAPSRTRPGW